MARTIADEFKKYLDDLTATSDICTAFGTTLSASTNLFTWLEPPNVSPCVTITPYRSGAPSLPDGNKYQSGVQIRIKHTNTQTAVKTGQSIINRLHNNTKVCASTPGVVFANHSEPMLIGMVDGGENKIVVTNFTVKYVKIT